MDEKTLLAQDFIKNLTKLKKLGFPKVGEFGLRQSEYLLLFTLSCCSERETPGMKASELSENLAITPAAVTHMINSLEIEGCVERINDPRDRRVVFIRPTDKGKEIIDTMNKIFFERMKELIDYIGEEDTRDFIRIFSKVLSFMKKNRSLEGENEL